MSNFSDFIGVYPVSKTLRFELRPIGKTGEWIKRNGVIEDDEKKASDYPVVKKLIDEYHKVCIKESLKDVQFNWHPLYEALMEYRKKKDEETQKLLETEQAKMCEQIGKALHKFEHYNELTAATPKELIKNILPKFSDESSLSSFNGFATYFQGFQENRRNIYSTKAISTGVPYRLVYDNFPKFVTNIDIYNTIKENCPDVITQASEELKPFFNGRVLDDVFSVGFYNMLLTQDGIDLFNSVIGGVSEDEKKYRGINEFANLYRQKYPNTASKKALTMIPLFKQILSDRETLSFIPQEILDETELVKSIEDFYLYITHFERNGYEVDVMSELIELVKKFDTFNPAGIYITGKQITEVSQRIYNHWNRINEMLFEYAVELYGDATKTKNKKKIDAYVAKAAFSLEELHLDTETIRTLYFKNIDCSMDVFRGCWTQFQEWKNEHKEPCFCNNSVGTEIVKNLFDSAMDILHLFSAFCIDGNYDADTTFYNEFTPLYSELQSVIPLYNRVRNFLTKKPSDVKKFKLNFGVPTLANGWDKNKESTNKAIILFKDGLSFLGILNAKKAPNLTKVNNRGKCFSKMVYKLLPGANKMLPHVFFSKTGKETYSPSRKILDIYDKMKKGSPINVDESRQLIDFYKTVIKQHPDWSKLGFVFLPTGKYEDISAFYNEISKQAYKISFVDISEEQIDEWVENGQMYLFQIYNKDYAKGAKGRKNLHTLYWENLFTEENLNNIVLRLNGEAKLFYRPQSITNPVIHKVGSKMLNKRDKDGMPIPDSIYRRLYQYYNGKISENDLQKEDRQYLGNVAVINTKHDIIKDRRFTKPEFFFHVPITFNVNADGNEYINEDVQSFLKNSPDINIIGIDRGERNLIYLTLINQQGEILKQKTFNTVNQFDYHKKLTQREKERDEARKSWASIGKIKDLKEGFLSAVIHEIAVMMVENNAIVVLEDLNFGFKRGRFKVERQVYQKFEKMFIDKLNYLCFKDRKSDEDGGILRGYQLAQKFVSFQRLGKQSGFLFYIPAAYTSKIDPVTGFVNHFNFNDITNAEKRKDFFMKMKRIVMKDGHIEFEFDYKDFNTFQTDYKNKWVLSTRGKRINRNGDTRYPTEDIIKAFAGKGVSLSDGMDIKALLSEQDDTIYKELFDAFRLTVQMRNSNQEEDFVISPVADKNGRYFCSIDEANKGKDADGNWVAKLPVDADANGAYHIALKGLYMLITIKKQGKPLKNIERIANFEWFKFMAEKPFLQG